MIRKDYDIDERKVGMSFAEKSRLVTSIGRIIILFAFLIFFWWYQHDNEERTLADVYMLCALGCSGTENSAQTAEVRVDSKMSEETQKAQTLCVDKCGQEYHARMADMNAGILEYYPPNYIKPMRSVRDYFWWVS